MHSHEIWPYGDIEQQIQIVRIPKWEHCIWSNFMRMHIDKKLCHFFMVNLSSLLTLIFIKIAWGLFLLLTFKFLIDNWIKNRPEGVQKSQNNFQNNSWWKKKQKFYSLNYTRLQKVEFLLNGKSDLYEILNFSS